MTERPDLPRHAELGHGLPRVMRLGLATRGNTRPSAEDVANAVERGVNYLNSCGYDDAIARAVRDRLVDRRKVVLAAQLGGCTARGMRKQLDRYLDLIGSDSLDVVTLYYVEEESEWKEIVEPGGAMEALEEARREGVVRMIGLTSHQRKLAARWAESGKIDLLMIRYNAALRGWKNSKRSPPTAGASAGSPAFSGKGTLGAASASIGPERDRGRSSSPRYPLHRA